MVSWRAALLASAGWIAITVSVRAQDAADQTTSQLPTVEVQDQQSVETATGPVQGFVAHRSQSGTKTDTPLLETPQSISVVTRDQMDRQGVTTVAQAVRYNSGVQTGLYGYDPRYDQILIRGFSIESEGDFRDGLRQPNGGWLAYWKDDPYTLERIDIIKGPASVLYGQTSPGGMINKITKRPLDVPFNEVELQYGSHNWRELRFDSSGPLDQKGQFLYRIVGLGRLADTPLNGSNHDDRALLAPSVTWRPNENTSLTILAEAMHFRVEPASSSVTMPNGTLSHRWAGDSKFNKQDQTQYGIGYEFEHRFNDNWTVRQNMRYNDIDLTARYAYNGGFQSDDSSVIDRYADILDENLYVFSLDNQVELKASTGPLDHTVIVGTDYQRVQDSYKYGSDAAPSLDLNDPDYTQPIRTPDINVSDGQQISNQIGVYAQDQIAWNNWRLTGGLRQDWSAIDSHDRMADTKDNQDDTKTTGRVGLLYLTRFGLAPYVSYATSFFPELGTNANGQPKKPTTGRQYELGVKYQPPGVNASITASIFDIKKNNVSTRDPSSDNPLDTIQTGQIRSRGFEIEGVASPVPGLNLIASYTYQDVEVTRSNDGDKGNRPSGIPEHLASAWGDYTIQKGLFRGLGGGLGVRYNGPMFADNQHQDNKIASFVLVDAEAHYDWRQYRFAVNADNLFDKDYVTAQDGYPYRGTGRTVIASIRVRW
jgi:iron complex outermembrane receptor protein